VDDKWVQAFGALGGITGIGVLIDLALYKSEKAKFKAKLEDWWLRFNEVKWSNFGRKEADLAVQILDRWAGPRLWSWKRWRFTRQLAFYVLMLVSLWILFRTFWFGNLAFWDALEHTVYATALYLPTLATLPLSISLTRFIAVGAARVSRGPVFSVVAFSVLLAVHVLLLLYWSTVVLYLEILLFYPLVVVSNFSLSPVARIINELLERGNKQGWHSWSDWQALFSFQPVESSLLTYDHVSSVVAYKVAMDFVANGPRIVFALAFLSSFMIGPQIKDLISRLWYGAMDSSKPVFTTLFGILGAVVAAAVRVFAQ
jgi:hypothetical protein